MLATTPDARRYVIVAGVLLVTLISLGVYAWHVGQAGWEVSVVRWLQDDGPPGLRSVSTTLAVLGTGLPWAVLIGLLGLGLLAFAGVRLAVLLLATAVLQDVGAAIKVLVERGRPVEGSVEVWRQIGSYSFPSGHTLGATLVFGFLFFALEHCALRTRTRRILQAACVVWILLMGISRMELGAHWPTDVLGAYVLGALLLVPIVAMLRGPKTAMASSEV
jgi:undecaprenyl-diphosphatase